MPVQTPTLRHPLALAIVLLAFSAGSAEAQGCFSVVGETRTISATAAGAVVDIEIRKFDESEMTEDAPSCIASTTVRLSSFPTSRVAIRPNDIAAAIRDTARELDAKECAIIVWYENDTSEELEDHERCIGGTFRYAGDSFWSSSRERNCWEPA